MANLVGNLAVHTFDSSTTSEAFDFVLAELVLVRAKFTVLEALGKSALSSEGDFLRHD